MDLVRPGSCQCLRFDIGSVGANILTTLYGYLHTLARGSENGQAERTMTPTEVAQLISDACHSNSAFGEYKGGQLESQAGWEIRTFKSLKPLMGEAENDLIGGPYPYPFYIFVNKISGRVIIGAFRYSICNAIITHLNYSLSLQANKRLHRFSFDVETIRREIESTAQKEIERKAKPDNEKEAENIPLVTLIQLDVNDFSSKIEAISISGDDVLGVNFLKRFSPDAFQAKQIGLRLNSSLSESCRLLRAGGMQFYSNRLKDLEICLGFVFRSQAVILD